MTMEIFKTELVKELQSRFGTTASIFCTTETLKGVLTELITIDLCGQNRSCSTPLHALYLLNLKGMNIQNIAEAVANSISATTSIDKSKIIYRLVNAAENENLLQRIPHIPFYDMAITFLCVMENENHRGFLTISNDLMEKQQLTLQQLTDLAQENTFHLYPCNVSPIIYDVFKALLADENATLGDYMDFAVHAYRANQEPPVFTVTCEDYYGGSAALLNTAFLSRIADNLKHDLLLMPGNERAFALIPYVKGMEQKDIHKMAEDALATGDEPILTRNIFLFSRNTKRLGLFV